VKKRKIWSLMSPPKSSYLFPHDLVPRYYRDPYSRWRKPMIQFLVGKKRKEERGEKKTSASWKSH